MQSTDSPHSTPGAWQALAAWGVFLVAVVALNGTVPFALGVDLRPWTSSLLKALLFSWIIYGACMLVLPLGLAFGWSTLRQRAFALPLLLAVAAIGLGPLVSWLPVLSLPALAYLHWRFNLGRVGFKFGPWRAEALAIVGLGLLGALPALLAPGTGLQLGRGLAAGLNRLLTNPAATVENLFYFGFLAERLAPRLGSWRTAPLIGALYTVHEMSNPEYWYSGRSFVFIFIGLTVTAAVYLWRRSVITVWLGDSLGRFLNQLI